MSNQRIDRQEAKLQKAEAKKQRKEDKRLEREATNLSKSQKKELKTENRASEKSRKSERRMQKEHEWQMRKFMPAAMADLLPVVGWDDKGNYGITCDGVIIDFLQITCKNLNTASDDEIDFDNLKWDKLYMTYPDDLKIVALNFPIDVSEQLEYIKRIAARTENPELFQSLEKEYDRLAAVSGSTADREYYLFFYAEDHQKYLDKKSKIKGTLNRGGNPLVTELNRQKKEKILYKLNNLNSRLVSKEGDML